MPSKWSALHSIISKNRLQVCLLFLSSHSRDFALIHFSCFLFVYLNFSKYFLRKIKKPISFSSILTIIIIYLITIFMKIISHKNFIIKTKVNMGKSLTQSRALHNYIQLININMIFKARMPHWHQHRIFVVIKKIIVKLNQSGIEPNRNRSNWIELRI